MKGWRSNLAYNFRKDSQFADLSPYSPSIASQSGCGVCEISILDSGLFDWPDRDTFGLWPCNSSKSYFSGLAVMVKSAIILSGTADGGIKLVTEW